MPFSHYAFVVILYSILGWCIESALYSISEKRRVNRGVLLGPWILSYGFGTLALVLISGVIPKNPMLIFASAALLGTVIYYVLWRALAYVIGMNRLPIAEKDSKLPTSDPPCFAARRIRFAHYLCRSPEGCGLVLRICRHVFEACHELGHRPRRAGSSYVLQPYQRDGREAAGLSQSDAGDRVDAVSLVSKRTRSGVSPGCEPY